MTPITDVNRCGDQWIFNGKVYECTCMKNHDGNHICHDASGRVKAEWENNKEQK